MGLIVFGLSFTGLLGGGRSVLARAVVVALVLIRGGSIGFGVVMARVIFDCGFPVIVTVVLVMSFLLLAAGEQRHGHNTRQRGEFQSHFRFHA